jgi:hypothetical protein
MRWARTRDGEGVGLEEGKRAGGKDEGARQ